MTEAGLLIITAAAVLVVAGQMYPVRADDTRIVQVQFPKGEIGTTIKDRIKGYDTVDYKLRVSAGQRMIAILETDNHGNYFNVLEPGESGEAVFIGSIDGNTFEGELSETGDYTIRVYLMRSSARRGETAKYKLDVAVAAVGSLPSQAEPSNLTEEDVRGSGTSFDATGDIPCALQLGQPTRSCRFGVKREGNGSALVTVFWPDGRSRTVFFDGGRAVGSDATEADASGGFHAERAGDLSLIRVGAERYEIPDAVVFGG